MWREVPTVARAHQAVEGGAFLARRGDASRGQTPWLDERGQTIVLFTVAMVAMLGFMAIVFDVGVIYQQRRSLQNPVDAAALAAASELPGVPAAADVLARTYLLANGVDVTASDVTYVFQSPFNGDPDRACVQVTRTEASLFGRFLGITQFEPWAHAAAERVAPQTGYALFAIGAGCGGPAGLTINGSLNSVVGGVHSNGKMMVSGSNNSVVGGTTYVCSFMNGGGSNTFTPAPAASVVTAPPVNFSYGDFTCDMEFTSDTALSSVSAAWVGGNPNSNQLIPGVYCSTRKLSLSGSNVIGNVTLVAQGPVDISGSNFTLTPYVDDVLAFSSDNSQAAIDVSGSGGSWSGYINAPNGQAKMAGSGNLSISGAVIADQISISGSDFSLDATGFGDITGTVSLIQ